MAKSNHQDQQLNPAKGGPGPQKGHPGGRSAPGGPHGKTDNANGGLTAISAPYNFVPLAEWVPSPAWASQVSQDLPFKDGLRGHLDLTITAHTPLLVGGKQNKNVAPGEVYPFEFPNGNYGIPGTSLKGMIRAVIEIASFSRMGMVDDRRMGVRDLTSGARPFYGNFMTATVGDKVYKARSKTGWLSFDPVKKNWMIQPCSYARVERHLLESYHSSPWVKINNKERPTAQEKYENWKKSLQVNFDPGLETEHQHSPGALVYSKANNLGRGKVTGTLVFTGQPSPKKHLEFIFHGQSGSAFPVPDEVFRSFLDIHDAKTENSEKTPWDYWRKHNQVPIFYLEDGRPGTVSSLGLALMYKLAYRHSIHEAIQHSSRDHLDESIQDFAALLFGRVGKDAKDCLKGRVIFGHAVAEGGPRAIKQPTTILNGPKPTYYPNYIKQPKAVNDRIPDALKFGHKIGYATLMDENCRIRGWKRYPVRPLEQAQVQHLTAEQETNKSVQTLLHTLPQNTVFRSRVVFHNLKPVELGALYWALTWCDQPELRHALGMGKPFGFGQVGISVDPGKSLISPNDPKAAKAPGLDECQNQFIAYMEKAAKEKNASWKISPQITSLLGMANPGKGPLKGSLRHMQLSTEQNNDFKKAKEAHLVLSDYSKDVHPTPGAKKIRENQGCEWSGVLLTLNPGNGELSVNHQSQVAKSRNPEAQQLRDSLPDAIKNRLKKDRKLKNCSVRVEPIGNAWKIVGILAVGETTIAS